ncbi:MAG TPA: hypothetical protein VFV19_07185 [Candidatus Polarisedimenticolaceae bacterium]|nr:hypothetical protein [Candidatus Polarisedimenticolaceae bacterium]
MIVLQLTPVVLSLLVLGAHFYRAGRFGLVAAVLVLIGLLAVRRRWAVRVVQAALVLGTVEWVRTTVELARRRSEAGEPFVRLVIILGAVSVVTLASALVFRSARLRRWYRFST